MSAVQDYYQKLIIENYGALAVKAVDRLTPGKYKEWWSSDEAKDIETIQKSQNFDMYNEDKNDGYFSSNIAVVIYHNHLVYYAYLYKISLENRKIKVSAGCGLLWRSFL